MDKTIYRKTKRSIKGAEKMIEMKYSKDRTCIVLDKGSYMGFNYAIVSYGTHPCCYVFLPETHRFYGKHYDEIDIVCHGGLTYSSEDLLFNPLKNREWVIGWDYAHFNDYVGFYELECLQDSPMNHNNDKKWTTEELLEEVKNVIAGL